jgi:DNA-binding transcriptional LysR family regulator
LTALEARVGVSLFDRSKQKIRPTEIGSIFVDYCYRVRDIVGELDRVLTGAPDEKARVASVKADFEDASQLLAPVVRGFSETFNGAEVAVTVVSQAITTLPDDVDIAIRIDAQIQPGQRVHDLASLPCSLWAS